jgi:hypothetical protein
VVNTSASYSIGHGFKSRFGDRISLLRFPCYSSVPAYKCRDLQLGHDRFLPHPFQFIINLSHSLRFQVLMTSSMKMRFFLNIAPYRFIAVNRRFRRVCCVHQHPDDGHSTYVCNVGLLHRGYTALYSRRLSYFHLTLCSLSY